MNTKFIAPACVLKVGALFIDQAIKLIALSKIPFAGIALIDSAILRVKLEKVLNPGSAFGLNLPAVLIIVCSVMAIAVLIYFELTPGRAVDRYSTVLTSLIIGGAASNLLDRFLHHGVIDYVSITIYQFAWPTFNLADALIIFSLILLIIKELHHKPI